MKQFMIDLAKGPAIDRVLLGLAAIVIGNIPGLVLYLIFLHFCRNAALK